MDNYTRQVLIEFLKDAFQKGYSSEQLKNMLLEKNISDFDANALIRFAQASVVRYEVPENTFTPILFIFLSLGIMAAVYFLKIFQFASPDKELSIFIKFLKGFWPLIFPLIANLVNFIHFRKSSARGLFITAIAIGLLILLVIILSVLGL